MTMIMYDTIGNGLFPPGAPAYAAYIDGHQGDQPNYRDVVSMFPMAHVLSIALFPEDDADCLDMENGAAPYAAFPGWAARQRARGVARPCGYASASPMTTQLLPVLRAAGITRPAVRLWSAHTGAGAHICGPGSCGQVPVGVDGTQWTFTALGRNLDESLLRADFFGTVPVPPWQETMMQALPVVEQGMTGDAVKTVQALCGARGATVRIDGIFGGATAVAIRFVQASSDLKIDAIVGPLTWPKLLGV